MMNNESTKFVLKHVKGETEFFKFVKNHETKNSMYQFINSLSRVVQFGRQ